MRFTSATGHTAFVALFRTTAFTGIALLVGACGGGGDSTTTPPPPPATVSSVSVTLSASSLTVGQNATASATLRTAAGAEVTGRTITWSSSNTSVATVSAAGVVSAVAAGTTTVRATSEGQSGSASLTVTPTPVASVALSTDSSDVPLRTSLQLTATTHDANGGTLPGRTVTWSVAPTGIATVNASGLVRMLQPGTVTVTATSEGRTGTARLRATVANLTAIVDSMRIARGMPAMGVAIVSREGLIGIGVAGTRRVNANIPVTVDDKWHIGSNTKALTGFLAGMAVQAGVISWDRTVEQAFPDLVGGMRAEYRDVTLRELLSHVGGIVNSTTGLTASTDLPTARTAWTNASVQQPPANARGVYYYSNNAFGMAGAMVERAWGSSYEELMQSRVWGPLGLQNAGWGPTTAAGANDQPQGHRLQGDAWVVCEGCDNWPGLSSAGTAHMPLTSWARMMQEVLLADQDRSALLTQVNARYLTTNHVPAGGGALYGIGWNTGGAAGNRLVTHDGSNTNNHSRAVIYLDAGVGFLLTINAADFDGGRTPATLNAMQARLDTYWQTGR